MCNSLMIQRRPRSSNILCLVSSTTSHFWRHDANEREDHSEPFHSHQSTTIALHKPGMEQYTQHSYGTSLDPTPQKGDTKDSSIFFRSIYIYDPCTGTVSITLGSLFLPTKNLLLPPSLLFLQMRHPHHTVLACCCDPQILPSTIKGRHVRWSQWYSFSHGQRACVAMCGSYFYREHILRVQFFGVIKWPVLCVPGIPLTPFWANAVKKAHKTSKLFSLRGSR